MLDDQASPERGQPRRISLHSHTGENKPASEMLIHAVSSVSSGCDYLSHMSKVVILDREVQVMGP